LRTTRQVDELTVAEQRSWVLTALGQTEADRLVVARGPKRLLAADLSRNRRLAGAAAVARARALRVAGVTHARTAALAARRAGGLTRRHAGGVVDARESHACVRTRRVARELALALAREARIRAHAETTLVARPRALDSGWLRGHRASGLQRPGAEQYRGFLDADLRTVGVLHQLARSTRGHDDVAADGSIGHAGPEQSEDEQREAQSLSHLREHDATSVPIHREAPGTQTWRRGYAQPDPAVMAPTSGCSAVPPRGLP